MIANYTLQSGDPASLDLTSSDSDLATSAQPATVNNDVLTFGFSGDYKAYISANDTFDTPAGAVGQADYFSFVITGTNFTIGQVSFDYELSDTFDLASYNYYLLGSTDNFSSSFVVGTGGITGTGFEVIAPRVDLDTTGVTELNTIASSVEIRFYFYDSATASHLHKIDNITVDSTPEPGTLALMALGGAMMIRRRRR